MAANDPLVELTGTIFLVEGYTFNPNTGTYSTRIILENSLPVNNVVVLPSRLLVTVNATDIIPFKVNDPITVKGNFKREKTDTLSYMYNVRAPLGYIRYDGRILR